MSTGANNKNMASAPMPEFALFPEILTANRNFCCIVKCAHINHSKSLKLLVPKNLVRCITNLYPGMSRTGQQHLFLKPGVEMDHVPSRQVGLSKGLVEYPRSLMIAHTTISDVTLAVIDNGKLVF